MKVLNMTKRLLAAAAALLLKRTLLAAMWLNWSPKVKQKSRCK